MNQKKTEQLEKQFTLDTIVPLLKALGFHGVRYTHGTDEYGRDLVFYDSDRFGVQRLFCAQVKYGNLSGSASSTLNTIISQIEDGMTMPFFDTFLNEDKFPVGFYLIISGEYTRNAKAKIRKRCRGKPVHFLDGTALEAVRRSIASTPIEETSKEVTRLVREARAAMRCTPPDLKQFENLLNQIDLIDGISGAEKVKALSEIGLEVTLNSVEGTRLLVEQLILVIVGWDEHPQIAKLISPQDAEALLDLVAANLWDWGVQSVEYQRKPEPVKICADSLYAILKIARKLQFKKAMNTCISGIDAMYQAAVRDRLDGLVALVGKSRTSLFKEVTSKPRVELKKQLDMIKKSIYANNLINNIGSRLWALKDFFLENDELLSIESNRVFYEKYLRDLSELERRPALNLAWHERYNEMLAALNDVGA